MTIGFRAGLQVARHLLRGWSSLLAELVGFRGRDQCFRWDWLVGCVDGGP